MRITAVLLLLPALAAAQEAPPARPTALPMRQVTQENSVALRAGLPLTIEAGAGRILQMNRAAGSVFAADPRVVEVRPASPTSLFLFGVAPGRTTIAALDGQGAPVAQYEVTVRPSGYGAGEAQAAIARLMPGRQVRAEARGNGLALLGEVATAAEAEQAAAIARGYLAEGQQIDNRLSVLAAGQVNLRVRIAEVSREVTRQLGVDWQAVGRSGNFAIGLLTRNALFDAVNPSSTTVLNWNDGRADVNAIIDALAQDRLITVLAEPNLTALSGETASFLVGGEFPIPIALRDNVVTVQFKQYGVSLAFVPTVQSQGRISLKVRPEVSELTDQGAVRLASGNASIQIPALTVRRAETVVELGSGQSFAIAGLLQDNARSLGRALPGIGEVPVLGALFRSDRFQRNETELVIIITPYVVNPASDPVALRPPIDRYVPPDDLERLLFFRQLSRVRSLPPRFPGEVGFSTR
ncbi:type II and III secretion system protein family protein [Paracraurococcus lichenis]|uniref:Type II and III secretion system protein family protein n=1 Tax=Paracraurococcus lichenis TaxID=3064888 RepID=A0ABT9DZ00_9PROT|nr:type II and III secretion system protein family protein [Paracraurococcus sp. LOR1-02]MDO9709134.1 type II and III secretion system protein family protein [Paracraurococcus sp. LOR1-02]